jgi:hypothetical protein
MFNEEDEPSKYMNHYVWEFLLCIHWKMTFIESDVAMETS